MDNLVSICMDAFGLLIDIDIYGVVLLGSVLLCFVICMIQWLFKVVS